MLDGPAAEEGGDGGVGEAGVDYEEAFGWEGGEGEKTRGSAVEGLDVVVGV